MKLFNFATAVKKNFVHDDLSSIDEVVEFAIKGIERKKHIKHHSNDKTELRISSLHIIFDNIRWQNVDFVTLFLTIGYVRFQEEGIDKILEQAIAELNRCNGFRSRSRCKCCEALELVVKGCRYIPMIIETSFRYYSEINEAIPFIRKYNISNDLMDIIKPFILVPKNYKEEFEEKLENRKFRLNSIHTDRICLVDDEKEEWSMDLLNINGLFCTNEFNEGGKLSMIDIESVDEVVSLFSGFRFKCLQITDNVSNKIAIALIKHGCGYLIIKRNRLLDPDFLNDFMYYHDCVQRIIIADGMSEIHDIIKSNASLKDIAYLMESGIVIDEIEIGNERYFKNILSAVF